MDVSDFTEGPPSSTVADRYARIRHESRLTKKAFAESLGIHPVVSGDIELGKRDPSRDVLVRLAKVYKVDINWLLTGSGADNDRFESGSGEIVNIQYVHQEAAAGRGVEIEQNAETTTLPVLRSFIAPWKPERVRAVEVRGDSMTGIGLDDRDIVFFVTGENTGDGIRVISVGSRLLVKRIHFDAAGKTVQIISENPQYPPRLLSGEELHDFRVEGTVIAWMHRY